MSNSLYIGRSPALACIVGAPETRRIFNCISGSLIQLQPLPTDAIGNFYLTLNNVVVGSRYRVEVSTTGATVLDGVAASSTLNLIIPVYISGTPDNDLKIKVRNASGYPAYQPYETQTTAFKGTTSIFINQLLDE